MERDGRHSVASFFADTAPVAGAALPLGEGAAHHARVKRLGAGDPVRVTDGAGRVATGVIASLGRAELVVEVRDASLLPPPGPIHLRVPVADRERMLWLAEKATELGITSWQTVRFRRSASVSPRGEGPGFGAKLRARMIAALEQSGGAWLPEILPEATASGLPNNDADALRLLLHAGGSPLLSVAGLSPRAHPVLLLGPEGGLESDELEMLTAAGWRLAALADTTLRFETAGVAAVAVCRALQTTRES